MPTAGSKRKESLLDVGLTTLHERDSRGGDELSSLSSAGASTVDRVPDGAGAPAVLVVLPVPARFELPVPAVLEEPPAEELSAAWVNEQYTETHLAPCDLHLQFTSVVHHPSAPFGAIPAG